MDAAPETDLHRELTSALAAVRARLLQAIVGVSEEQFKRRPAASEGNETPWCIAEVLAHLLDSERLQAERMGLALGQDGVEVEAEAAEARAAAARAGRVSPVPQLIHGLLASRRQVERLLDEAVAADALGHVVRLAGAGPQSIEAMVREDVIAHEAEHVEQILALRLEVGAAPLQSGSMPAGDGEAAT